ncbi:MAG: hypothetical protein P8Z80_15435, partial [Pseudolabrys sp.]
MSFLTSRRLALAAALVGSGFMVASVAYAFTMEDATGNGQDQSFLYPDRGAAGGDGTQQGFTSKDGMTTYRDGNTTLQFGHRRSFDQRYNADHLFDPL